MSTPRRHMWIPDTQVHPGVPIDHIGWAAQAIVEYLPDVIVVGGDWWDMPSLSSYEKPGSLRTEGQRIKDDIEIGNLAFDALVDPMQREIQSRIRGHQKRWTPECHFLFGNHEDRLTRAVNNEPKLLGVISLDQMETPGFTRHEFLEIVDIDGVSYSHYFANIHSGRPIGGSVTNRLNQIGRSFVQGHVQGFDYGTKPFPGGLTRHGVVAGSFYQHNEHYRGPQGRDEWRGIIVMNEVHDGDFNIMPLTLDYLRRRFS